MRPFFHRSLFLALLGLSFHSATAQVGVGIGILTPDPSAALEIASASKGLLVPRVALTAINDVATISAPANGLTVYNTSSAQGLAVGLLSNQGTPTAPNWQPAGATLGWSLLGNAASDPAAQFLGTTDNKALVLRTNNVEAARLLPGNGALWLGQGNGLHGVLLGYQAGDALTTGSDNTFVGYQAGRLLSTGSYNTLLGQSAGAYTSTGSYNTFLGREAGANNNTGSFNTFVGQGSGNTNTSGYSNVFVGRAAGGNVTNGYNNTFLGPYSGISSTSHQLHNAAAIGYSAIVDKDDAIVLGGTGFNAVNVGVGTIRPDASAVLDLTSTSRGALLPRVALTSATDATSVPTPATYLLLVNTATRPGLAPGMTINMGTPTAPQWVAVNPAADPAFLRTSAATLALTAGMKTVLASGAGDHEFILPDASTVPGRQFTIVRAYNPATGAPASCTLTVTGSDIVQDQQYGSVYNGSTTTPPNNTVVSNFVSFRLTSLTIQSDGGAANGGIGWVVVGKY